MLRRRGLAGGLLLCALAATACDGSQAAPEPTAPALHDIASGAASPPLDPKAAAFKQAVSAAGVPATQPDATTVVIADGICRQLAAKTSERQILDKLQPLAAYTAAQTDGKLNADQVASIYLDNAKSTYC